VTYINTPGNKTNDIKLAQQLNNALKISKG